MKEELYYIQDTRQVVGNCALWWKSKRCGYTTDIDEAGLYSQEEAFSIAAGRDTDKPWPKSIIEKHIVRHVRVECLHRMALEKD